MLYVFGTVKNTMPSNEGVSVIPVKTGIHSDCHCEESFPARNIRKDDAAIS
jgi:hypothetical protein